MSAVIPEETQITDRSEAGIRDWVAGKIARRIGVTPAEVSLADPLGEIGLDSMEAIGLISELEKSTGCRFEGNPLDDYESLLDLAQSLAGTLSQGETIVRRPDR